MVSLCGPVGVLSPNGGLQAQADIFSSAKSPTKQSGTVTLDAASVTDVARPHRGGSVNLPPRCFLSNADLQPETPGEPEHTNGSPQPNLVRSPSGSKLMEAVTSFPFGACFTFWLRGGGYSFKSKDFGQELKELGSCTEVVDFWKYFNGIVLDRLPAGSLLGIFRHPDRPRAGPKAPGGRWLIHSSAEKAASTFEELSLALVGGEFDESVESAPCGVALSMAESQVEVWNNSANDVSCELVIGKIRDLVGEQVSIEYRPHRASNGGGSPLSAATSPTR